ncbi:MAG: chloride channel protein [Desulfurivibrionaceae bacterium]
MRLFRHFYDLFYPLIIAVIIGALAGLGAVAFRWLISFIILNFQTVSTLLTEHAPAVTANIWIILLPALAGLIIGPIITFWAPEVRGPGVPEVMEALALRSGHIRHRVTLIKSFVTAVLIAAGASVGREGPIVQIGSSIGSTLSRLLRLDHQKRRIAVVCGAAAGIAATFQAPMAGTLFAVEILLFDLETAFLSHIVIASVTGTLVARSCWDDPAIFHIPSFSLAHTGELAMYLGLGIAAGVLGVLLMKAIITLPGVLKRLNIPLWLTPAAGGLLVGIIGFKRPETLGIGYESISNALLGEISLYFAAILVLTKIMTTCFSIGSGMSGGIFAPALFIGAMTGTVFGHLAQLIWPDTILSSAHYALIGMGAMVSGVTLAPITAIMTIFELTYNYEVILPLMVACISSLLVVRIMHGYSIYEDKLLQKGIDISRGHEVNRLRNMLVKNFMIRDLNPLQVDDLLSEANDRMTKSDFPHFIVLDGEGRLAGVLTLRDLRNLRWDENLEERTVEDLMQREVVTVEEEDSLETTFHIFSRNEFSFLPVVKKGRPDQVTGYLKRADIISAYDRHVLRERALEPKGWGVPGSDKHRE